MIAAIRRAARRNRASRMKVAVPRLMARKLKVCQTALGFFDQAVAAPSMKAALEAWGSNSNLFHQGAARETDDPEIVAATMAKPGVVLRRVRLERAVHRTCRPAHEPGWREG
jgi:hypothetical protein